MTHLAVLFDDGSVYDLSLEEKISPSKGWILKLPKKEQYHGYSDEKGFLYFVDGELISPVTRYHKSISQKGHDTIPINNNPFLEFGFGPSNTRINNFVFRRSILVGDYFWLLGNVGYGPEFWIGDFLVQSETIIWYKKKEKLGRGPDLPSFLNQNKLEPCGTFCTLSLNSTHLMIFGFFKQNDFIQKPKRVAIVDFYKRSWIDWTPFYLEDNVEFCSCFASLVFEKTKKAIIWLVVEKSLNNEMWIEIMSHELSHGSHWKVQSTYVVGVNLLSILYSLSYFSPETCFKYFRRWFLSQRSSLFYFPRWTYIEV